MGERERVERPSGISDIGSAADKEREREREREKYSFGLPSDASCPREYSLTTLTLIQLLSTYSFLCKGCSNSGYNVSVRMLRVILLAYC